MIILTHFPLAEAPWFLYSHYVWRHVIIMYAVWRHVIIMDDVVSLLWITSCHHYLWSHVIIIDAMLSCHHYVWHHVIIMYDVMLSLFIMDNVASSSLILLIASNTFYPAGEKLSFVLVDQEASQIALANLNQNSASKIMTTKPQEAELRSGELACLNRGKPSQRFVILKFRTFRRHTSGFDYLNN